MRFSFFVLGFLFIGCGVKAPPVAPERKTEPAALNLNCSPNDPDCDKEDPKYVPKGKKGKYPAKNDD